MVRYTSQYDALVQIIHASDSYKGLSAEVKKPVDNWLSREDVRKYFSGRIVPQLSFPETLVLSIVNSDSMQQRTPEVREMVIKSLDSDSFRRYADALERMIASV